VSNHRRLQGISLATAVWVLFGVAPGVTTGAEVEASPSDLKPPPSADSRACPELTERPVREIKLDISLSIPNLPDCSTKLFRPPIAAADAPVARRAWQATEFTWEASELYHTPLYFEDVTLERYGQSCRPWVQPWLSGAHFFGTFPFLPYKMAIDPPREHIYTLGYRRAGSPNPWMGRRFPWELRASLVEASAWLVFAVALP
jgi:hypothetical protein